ncbi:MAG TPA: hypothetical protein HA359_00210 [Candidatus Poseidoniaceae archaeon]|jgi:hypothetical protein|nr:MAG TPA: hypothetical protein D7H84_00215 [Candidatus Poseidoniales archaeon]DAC60412.1 MAG TPA: hypothetical protein D7I03_02295 [Candidatus Poseidoniales archaeon]HII22660.1 hypothetical protein [Candidatus Poseidoniaceae archaeon]HII50149.1 hypothetical protein [Candidatus Poseidoniaceae archaeon]|tara:strand:+ start:584 stop:952 length:369 start_codon:yes stop_codon:yes gene_type:complete
MGVKDRLRNLFENSNSEEVEILEETVETDADKEQFLALASQITDELIHELVNEDIEVPEVVETILISEYDAGDVEIEQLIAEEDIMPNHNDVNVVNHDSLEDIVEYLEGAEIIGDLPEEVTF